MFAIARFTVIEAWRRRLWLPAAAVGAGLCGLAEFSGALSLAESEQVQAPIAAALLRLFAVVGVCLFVITSGLRELHDKSLELLLAMPMPRHHYLLGKLCGHGFLALALAAAFSLPLFLYAPPFAVACWALSLACELLLVVALSLACLFTFRDATPAFAAAMMFYLLARSLETLRLLSVSPLLESGAPFLDFIRLAVTALALLLPDLAAFTRSGWLAHGVPAAALGTVLVQTALYLAVLAAVGMFDLYRKNV